MARDRERACIFYTYEGGPCKRRGISAHFREECQTCKYWKPIKGGRPARTDNRRKKMERIQRKESW